MATHQPESGTLEGGDAPRLYFRWHPVADARGVVVVVHGLAEHSGRYVEVFEAINAVGCAALGVDLRGHGHSAGTRVYIDRFTDYLDDVGRAVDEARVRQPEGPLFVLGHSMGGLIATHHALSRGAGIAGYILSSPGLRSAIKIPGWKNALGMTMSKLWPKLAIPTGIGSDLLSTDPAVAKAYDEDPLVTSKATARWYAEFVAAQADAAARAGELKHPFLMLLGEDDKLVDPAGGRDLFERASAEDKTLKSYPGMLHEPFHEVERARVLGDLRAWLSARL